MWYVLNSESAGGILPAKVSVITALAASRMHDRLLAGGILAFLLSAVAPDGSHCGRADIRDDNLLIRLPTT